MTTRQRWALALVGVLLMAGKTVGVAVKPGVILPLTPEMEYMKRIVGEVWARHGRVATITSGLEGEHMENSLHYSGLALDFRTKDIPQPLKGQMVNEVRAIAGTHFFVDLEYEGAPNEHMHTEYDRGE